MKKKHLVAALSLLLLVVVVATSVHVMHRDAMAAYAYTVDLMELNRQGGEPMGLIAGVDVEMRFYENFVWSDWIDAEDQNGTYKVSRENLCSEWEVRIVGLNDIDWNLSFPSVNPCSHGTSVMYFMWCIVFDD